MEVLSFRRVVIVSAHIGDQLRHLIRPIDGKPDGRRGFLRGAAAAVDIPVYLLAATAIALKSKGADAVALHQLLEDLQLQPLEFRISVGGFSQRDDPCVFRHGHALHRLCIRCKRSRVHALPSAKAAEAHKYKRR